MGLEPVGADADVDDDGDGKGKGVDHGVADELAGGVFLVEGHVEDEFVVDLEEHAGAEVVVVEFSGDAGHGEFDHVGGGALNGGVDGGAFGGGAEGGVLGGDVADESSAAGFGFDVAVFAAEGDGVVHVGFDAGEGGEVGFDDVGGVGAGKVFDALGEAKGGDAVHDAEVDHFGGSALGVGDVVEGDSEDTGGGGLVDVFAAFEGFTESGVAAHVGHDA